MIARTKKTPPPFQIMPTAERWEDAMLASSVERFGVLVPILVDDGGAILDGHRRKAIAERLKKDCPSIVFAGLPDEVKASVALEANLVRRVVKPREVIRSALLHSPHITDNFLAELLNTTNKPVRAARLELEKAKKIPRLEKLLGKDGKWRPRAQIRKTIICGNAKELAAAVQAMPHLKHGRRTMDAGTAIKRAKLKEKLAARQQRHDNARQLEPDADFPIFHCRFQDLGNRIADGSIDLVYTDPPWCRAFLEAEMDDLAAFAYRVLRPGGLLAVVYGVQFNFEMMQIVNRVLPHIRTLTATWNGVRTPVWEQRSTGKEGACRIVNGKRDIFIFYKDEWNYNRNFCDTFFDNSPEPEKDYHPWQQRIGYTRHFVQMLTEPGYRVCDPMCGSATTGVACKQLDRRSFIGCECIEEYYRKAVLRLSETPLFGVSPPTINSLSPIKTLSLFSGIGVGAAYARECGVDVVLANELEPDRCEVHKQIYPDTEVIQGDLRKENVASEVVRRATELGVKLIVATPPCQGFSTLNNKDKHDPRNRLVFDLCKVVNEIAPDYVLLENVPQLLTARLGRKPILDIIRERLPDYTLRHAVIDAKYCDTPQTRRRAIVLLSRSGLPVWDFAPLDESKPVLTLRDAIGDLESLDAGYESSSHKWHFAQQHAANHILWMRHTPSGKAAAENPEHFPSKNGRRIKSFANTYKRMAWDEPAPTLIRGANMVSSSNTVHPGWKQSDGTFSDARTLSILEAMRVMGLPDDWPLPENVGYRRAMEYLGDGLCPKVLKYLASTLPAPPLD